VDSPATEHARSASYYLMIRCPACGAKHRAASSADPCPECGAAEVTAPAEAPQLRQVGDLPTRLVRNWPMTLAALILVPAGPFAWLESGLRMAVTSYRNQVFHYAFARQMVPKLMVQLPVGTVLLAVLGAVAFIVGLVCVSMSKHAVPIRPKVDKDADPAAPLELRVPEWMSHRGGARHEVTYKAGTP
jgi:hypothetical protein